MPTFLAKVAFVFLILNLFRTTLKGYFKGGVCFRFHTGQDTARALLFLVSDDDADDDDDDDDADDDDDDDGADDADDYDDGDADDDE